MSIRINKAIKEFGVGLQTIADFLKQKGCPIDDENSLNQKLDDKQYNLLKNEYGADKNLRDKAEEMRQNRQDKKHAHSAQDSKKQEPEMIKTVVPEDMRPNIVAKGKIDLDNNHAKKAVNKPADNTTKQKAEKIAEQPNKQMADDHKAQQTTENAEVVNKQLKADKNNERPSVEERAKSIGEEENGVFKLHTQSEITGPKVLGTIDLSAINPTTRPKKKSKEERRKERKNGQAAGGQQGNNAQNAQGQNGQRKKRTRIGNERVDVNNAANQPKMPMATTATNDATTTITEITKTAITRTEDKMLRNAMPRIVTAKLKK